MSWNAQHEAHAHTMREQNEQAKHPGPKLKPFPSQLPGYYAAEPWWERRIEYLITRGSWEKAEMARLLELRAAYQRSKRGQR